MLLAARMKLGCAAHLERCLFPAANDPGCPVGVATTWARPGRRPWPREDLSAISIGHESP
eukprot:3225528-Pyramimonas_sp.AAC.1